LGDPHVAQRAAAMSQAADDADALDPYGVSTHPPRATRVAALPERSRGEWDPSGPLRLRNPDALDQWCVRELVGSGRRSEQLRPVRVLDCSPEQFDPPFDQARAALVQATGFDVAPEAMTATLDAIADGSWVRLARAIDPEIDSAPTELRAALDRDVLVGCLGTAVSGCLLDAGWRRSSRWLTSVLVHPSGEDVDIRHLIEQALDSADPTPLRSLLALDDPRAMA